MSETIEKTIVERADSQTVARDQTVAYEKPEVKTLCQRDVVQAVNQGSKFPARGFAG